VDPQRLEGAGRGVDPVMGAGHDGVDDAGELAGPGDGPHLARRHDGAGDAAGETLFPVAVDEVGKLGLACGVDHVGGGGAGFREAHVERPVEAEGKAALGILELQGGGT
jgi:hypothetical protein